MANVSRPPSEVKEHISYAVHLVFPGRQHLQRDARQEGAAVRLSALWRPVWGAGDGAGREGPQRPCVGRRSEQVERGVCCLFLSWAIIDSCCTAVSCICMSFSQVLVYNSPGGKRNRGLSVIGSLRELLPPNQLTQDVVQRALLVGWCIELVRTCSAYLLSINTMKGQNQL